MEDTTTTVFIKLIDKFLAGLKSYQLWLSVFIFRILVFFIPDSVLAFLNLKEIQTNFIINILFIVSISILLVQLFTYFFNKLNRRRKLKSCLKNISLDDAKMIMEFINTNTRTLHFSITDGIAESLMRLAILEQNVNWMTHDSKRAYSMSMEAWTFFRKQENIEYLKKIINK